MGRIVSTPTVTLWLGHVTADDYLIYEIAINDSKNTLIGMIPANGVECPYNSRPREQLFRIEYNAGGGRGVVYGDVGMAKHLVTANTLVRCDLVTSGEARNAAAAETVIDR